MKISSPFIIGPRLLPALRVGDAIVSLGYSTRPGDESRTRYQWCVDLPSGEHEGDDLQSGNVREAFLQQGFGSLLCFLGACGEALSYARRRNLPLDKTENAELFPLPVAEWAAAWADELSYLSCLVEEEEGLIDEAEEA